MARKRNIDDTDYQLREQAEEEQLLDLIMPGETVETKETAKPNHTKADPKQGQQPTSNESEKQPQATNDADVDKGDNTQDEANDEPDVELDSKSARKKLIESLADDEGEKTEAGLSFVLGGNILTTKWLRKQILWLVMVVVLAFAYVSNRYYAQQQQVHIEHLKRELKTTHYDAMARSAQLMKLYRRSTIIEHLNQIPGNTLVMPQMQPAVIPND